MDRRTFAKIASFSALSSSPVARSMGVSASGIAGAAVKLLRLGVIGAGSRGQEVMRQFLHLPGVSIRAVCDVYPPRQQEVNRLAGAEVPFMPRYEDLLSRTDVDAILIASPLAFHAEHTLAAIKTGIPIYGEKAQAFKPDECQQVASQLIKSRTLYQVGHQYRYASWAQESYRRIRAGHIGRPTHIYAYWHRNGNWRRPVPSPDPDGRLEHLINWRLYRESSGGLVTELGSHHLDMANWIFGEIPASVIGTSSICKYHDGRTVGDNNIATFNYSEGRKLLFSSITDNAKDGNEFWVYGDEGSVQITMEDATFYYEKSKHSAAIAPSGKTVVQNGIVTGASYSTRGEMPYRGEGERIGTQDHEDSTLTAVRSFVEAVHGEHPVEADAMVGYGSAIACAVAHDAVITEEKMTIPALKLA
jgi:predicted dehydrogenase